MSVPLGGVKTLGDVRDAAERGLARGRRLAARRKDLLAALRRAEARGATTEELRRAREDVSRVERSVERVIARVEALRDLAKAMETGSGR